MGSRFVALTGATLLAVSLLTSGAGVAQQSGVLEIVQPSLGEKCQRTRPSDEEQARLQGLDPDEASRIATRFDTQLNAYKSYGGAY